MQRNIANTFNPKDPSALAFLAYAVNALGVSHVIVCGHKNCGGVQAALASAKEVSIWFWALVVVLFTTSR